jgi:ssDNA-binding Zn-finger/Zn-ribbon topoisomerase 1
MEWFVLVGMLLFVLLVALGKRQGGGDEFPYEANGALFSPAERSFFGILDQAVQGKAVVFGKVRVADVIRPLKAQGRGQWQKHFNRISSKHFDYMLCAPDTLAVLAVVELDDKSHSRGKRADRDRFLEGACAAAGITLHRFKASAAYNIAEIRAVLFPPPIEEAQPALEPEPVAEQPVAQESPAPTEAKSEPLCPKCASPLVRKVARKGEHKGRRFLACSAFPKCRYIAKSDS